MTRSRALIFLRADYPVRGRSVIYSPRLNARLRTTPGRSRWLLGGGHVGGLYIPNTAGAAGIRPARGVHVRVPAVIKLAAVEAIVGAPCAAIFIFVYIFVCWRFPVLSAGGAILRLGCFVPVASSEGSEHRLPTDRGVWGVGSRQSEGGWNIGWHIGWKPQQAVGRWLEAFSSSSQQ